MFAVTLVPLTLNTADAFRHAIVEWSLTKVSDLCKQNRLPKLLKQQHPATPSDPYLA